MPSNLCRRVLHFAVLLALTAVCASANQSGTTGGTAEAQQAGISSSQNPCERASTTKGRVVSISYLSAGEFMGGLLLDGTKEDKAAFDQVYVQVRNTAQVYEKHGKECRVIPFTAIKLGQRIQVQSTGIVLQSAPPRIEAVEIVLFQ